MKLFTNISLRKLIAASVAIAVITSLSFAFCRIMWHSNVTFIPDKMQDYRVDSVGKNVFAALLIIVVAAVIAPNLSRRLSDLLTRFAYATQSGIADDDLTDPPIKLCSGDIEMPAPKRPKNILCPSLVSQKSAENHNQDLKEEDTKRKQMKKTLQKSEQKFRTIFELSSEAIMLMDRDGNILDVNKSLCECLGYKQEEIVGKNLLNLPFMHAASVNRVIENLAQRIAGMSTFSCELTLTARDGEERFGRVVTDSVRNDNGEVIWGIVMILDVTDHKRSEKALRESMEREARAYAQGRLEVLDTILHNIGNAINSVAIGIGTVQENLLKNRLTRRLLSLADAVKEHQSDFSNYIENDPQGQKVAPFIIALADDFVKHNEELARTVNRVSERAAYITDIARMQKISDTRYMYRKAVNVRKTIKNAIAILRERLRELNIEVIIDFSNAPSEITIQESQFHQMMSNLISNSIEAIDSRRTANGLNFKPFIRIDCKTESDFLIIEVEDNSIGVEKNKLKTIIRSEYSTENSESGIGFYSVMDSVNRCGGQVQALSNGINEGATIRIALPLSPSA